MVVDSAIYTGCSTFKHNLPENQLSQSLHGQYVNTQLEDWHVNKRDATIVSIYIDDQINEENVQRVGTKIW